MEPLYKVENSQFKVTTPARVEQYLNFVAKCRRQLARSRIDDGTSHPFCFGVNDSPLDHWDYMNPAEEGMLFRPHHDRPQGGYLLYQSGRVTSLGLAELGRSFQESATKLMEVKREISKAPDLAARVSEAIIPVTAESKRTKQRTNAHSAVWEVDRLLRLYAAKELYVSVAVK